MSAPRAETIEFLHRHRAERHEHITEALVETIEQSNPGYRATNLVPHSDLWRSCHDNVRRVLELLSDAVGGSGPGVRAERDPAYDAARETGRRRAEQGLPLDDVQRSFRIGGRLIWADIVEFGQETLGAEEVREIGTRLWEVVDETSAQVATAYHLHERVLVRADEQQRAELWEGLLGGRAREPWYAQEASRLLDVPVAADFVVVVASSVEVGRADVRLSPHATAWVRRTGETVGLVALRSEDLTESSQALQEIALRDEVPLGISGAQSGLAEIEAGYRQAALALRAQGKTVGAACFDDRLPEALLLRAPDIASRILGRWLGPVLALPAGEADALLETLVAWVGTGGSAAGTATAVHCHRNTVTNRLRRVTELTGRPLADAVVPTELDLALRVWRMGLRP